MDTNTKTNRSPEILRGEMNADLRRWGRHPWSVASLPPSLKLWRTGARPTAVGPWSDTIRQPPVKVVLARPIVTPTHFYPRSISYVPKTRGGDPIGLASEATLHDLARRYLSA